MQLPPKFTATMHVRRPHEDMRPWPNGISLDVLNGLDAGKSFKFLLGSDKKRIDRIYGGRNYCEIELRDSSISHRHFEIDFASGATHLRDLNSTNGLWIGGARIEGAWLTPGTEFYAGECRLRVSNIEMTETPVSTRTQLGSMLGASEATRVMFSLLERIAPTPMTVLITGESGTGKGEVARTIHSLSEREGPFQAFDCAAIPKELAAGLVLGHAKGAFTGAHEERAGPFEKAHGGTLFLDEIGELPIEVQNSLLNVVDRKELVRVGETQIRKVDVRIVAATNRDLAAEVIAGRFKHDLLNRLRQFIVTTPPLRERRDDIVPIGRHFLAEFAKTQNRTLQLGDDAVAQLMTLRWEGNVRQLKDVIRRAAYLAQGSTISREDLSLFDDELPSDTPNTEGSLPSLTSTSQLDPGGLKACVVAYQRWYCELLMQKHDGNLPVAALEAGYTVPGLRYMLGKIGLAHLIG